MENKSQINVAGGCDKPAGRPIPQNPDALLYTVEAAFLLGLSSRTLEALRLRGGGPPYVQVTTKAVRYKREDLTHWISERRRISTSNAPDDRCPHIDRKGQRQ